MVLKKKPIKHGTIPKPPNPRAQPGSFVIQGKAWYDEDGVMVIDEDGDIPDEIEEDLVQRGNFLYELSAYRKNDRVPRGRRPSYELKWCPVARKPKKLRKTS